MARNSWSLVAVSNPIPSSLRRQNLSVLDTALPVLAAVLAAPPMMIRFLPLDFHFFISRCFPQLLLRAKLITLFLIPECAQPAFGLNREESHVSIRLPMHIDFL
jgi:hypothetical protein